jgi:hypothetical protein
MTPRLPLPVASTAATMPISVVSMFSSPWDKYTVLSRNSTLFRIARLLTSRLHTGLPVFTCSAWNTPSVPPTIISRWPLTVATMGVE